MSQGNLENDLRRKAETLAEGRAGTDSISPADKDILLHELRIHQIELELQNEELRRVQQDLQISRNLYAELFEFAPVGYFILNRHFLIESANLAGSRILGVESRYLAGKRFMSFVASSDQDVLRHFISQGGDSRKSCEAKMHRRDGMSFFAELKVTEESTGKGDAKYRVAVVDITEHKRMENELRAARDELENRVKERTRELNERSNQLRNMTVEVTFAEQRERQRVADILHDELQQILVGAKYHLDLAAHSRSIPGVADLISKAIEVSRSLTTELSPPVLIRGDLVTSLEWLVHWMREKHGLEASLTVRQPIRPLPEALFLLLFHAARELLFNVVKHAGVRAARIEIDASEGQVLMKVEDEGSGFDPHKLPAEGGPSGGLGLFGIGERLSYVGGRIDIDSAPGRGSRFKLTAPFSSAAPESDKLPVESRAKIAPLRQLESTSPGAERKIRIMLVDDHLMMRKGLAGLLQAETDFEVSGEASDGESAVRLAHDIRPDVVLMDISMPGMDGIQATKLIHSEFPEIRIIGLSMFQEESHKAGMREAGVVAYLTKSGPSEDLIETIRSCVR
jgi:PAS domain S-box-containing protein